MTKSDSTRDMETNGEPTAATTSEKGQGDHRPTLGEISHTHPDTDEAFGAAMAYKRGPVIAADGGERGTIDESVADGHDDGESDADERMRDVDHAPPDGDDVNRVHQRGGEGRDGR